MEGLKALIATLQSQLQRSRERLHSLEEQEALPAAPRAGEVEALGEALAAVQMQHISALSETRRLQGEVSQLRGNHALVHVRLQERERDVQSLLAEIQEGAAGDASAAAAAAWEGKAQRLSARLKRCKVRHRVFATPNA